MVQKGNEKFELMRIFVEKEEFYKICKEIRKRSGVPITEHIVLITFGDSDHPIISLEPKKEIVENKEVL